MRCSSPEVIRRLSDALISYLRQSSAQAILTPFIALFTLEAYSVSSPLIFMPRRMKSARTSSRRG
jgi:hypothetical protein